MLAIVFVAVSSFVAQYACDQDRSFSLDTLANVFVNVLFKSTFCVCDLNMSRALEINQFLIFNQLCYCFEETVGFDVKASFARHPVLHLILILQNNFFLKKMRLLMD